MSQTGHLVCSTQDISCVPRRTSRVFQARQFLCSKLETSCVPRKTFPVFHAKHLLCSKQNISCYRHTVSSYYHIIISSYDLITSSYRRPRRKNESRFWAKTQRKKRNSSLNPFTKKRRDLKFGTSGVIFRGESAGNTQKFVAPPKRAIFDVMLTFCAENFIKIFSASKNQMSGIF